VLRGTKYYISGVDEAAALLVVARTGAAPSATAESRKQGRNEAPLSLFIVPADSPGLQRQVLPVDLLLPEKQFTLHFDDVRVGPEALVGREGDGFRQVFQGLHPERITGAAQCVGIARYVLGALMIRQACWQHDHGEPAGEAANMAKYAAAEAAIAAADAAMQTHGGNGFATEYGLLPYWASARLLRVAPVNREMILNYVAQHSLGLPRSY